MHIVTDSGTNLCLSPDELAGLNIHVIPLRVTLSGELYREEVGISTGEFYKLLAATDSLPVASRPASGDKWIKMIWLVNKGTLKSQKRN